MAVTTKATPQLLRLNNIKANNSEMIQKSNTLHSSNSIKRTQSQRRQAEAKLTTSQRRRNAVNPSVEPNCQENIISQDDEEEVLYTPAVMITGPSARSSAHSATSIDPRPLVPSLVLEPRPLNKNYGTKRSTTVVMREHEELESSSAMSDSLVRAPTSSSVASDGTDTSQNKHRNSSSTTSTASDARSTMTRGEGEEIMIFWDGNRRDSKTNVSSSPNQ
ncbi:hypothetical protein BGX28_005401 [Mortierella sp. GBA30]|nr:hypothetical protein BGX28_005401 [Mortierella sp. GBA30]